MKKRGMGLSGLLLLLFFSESSNVLINSITKYCDYKIQIL